MFLDTVLEMEMEMEMVMFGIRLEMETWRRGDVETWRRFWRWRRRRRRRLESRIEEPDGRARMTLALPNSVLFPN
jgi:hypothetical protein